ncbi:MAG TPA: hypothetical protein VH704_07055 [Casimicrobiaceae bacterium]|jgi:hypothetical protein|nr:hypothetical protein [Casimicrobiaceae bacterium]
MHPRLIFTASVVAFSLGAAAQTPTTTSGAAPLVAPSTCVKPEFSGRLASDPNMTAFNRQFKTYGECVKAYVEHNKAIAEAATAAANRVVDEYNTYTADVKAKIEAENSSRKKDAVQ